MSDRLIDEPLGRVGAWGLGLGNESTSAMRDAALEIEALGYPTVWIPEPPSGRDPLVASTLVLGATKSLSSLRVIST